MGEIKITLETLYDILRNEKKREDLQKLEDSFFVDVVAYLREKQFLLNTKTNESNVFAVGEKEKLEYELRSIKRILKQIYELREKKIIDIALNKSRTGSDIIDTSSMLRVEKDFYHYTLKTLDHYRRSILLQLFKGDLPDVSGSVVLPTISSLSNSTSFSTTSSLSSTTSLSNSSVSANTYSSILPTKKVEEKALDNFSHQFKESDSKELRSAAKAAAETAKEKALDLKLETEKEKSSGLKLPEPKVAEKKPESTFRKFLHSEIGGETTENKEIKEPEKKKSKEFEKEENKESEKKESKELEKKGVDWSGKTEMTKVRFIHPVPSFIWKDMKEYGPFDVGEFTEIYPEVADLLIRKGRAEKV